MRDQKDRKELMLLIMTYELKDWLNSINLTKENLLETDPTSKKVIHHTLSIVVCQDI